MTLGDGDRPGPVVNIYGCRAEPAVDVRYPENGPPEWEERITQALEAEYRNRSVIITLYLGWNEECFSFALTFIEDPPIEFFDPAALMGVRPDWFEHQLSEDEAKAQVRRVLERIGVPLA